MEYIAITRGALELARIIPNQPSVLVGRSPNCDVCLQASDVFPIHFLVEWVGDGRFAADSKMWSIFDISSSDPDQNGAAGVLLTKEPVQLSGFKFSWKQDRLEKTPLTPGVLSQQISGKSQRDSAGLGYALEVMQIQRDSSCLERVSHFPVEPKRGYRPKVLPGIKIKWSSDVLGEICWVKQTPLGVWNKNERVFDPTVEATKSSVAIHQGDLMLFRFPGVDYLFRLVPRIQGELPRLEVLADPFLKWLIGALALSIGLALYLKSLPPLGNSNTKSLPPRIARVEIEEIKPLEQPKEIEEPREIIPPVQPFVPPKALNMTKNEPQLKKKVLSPMVEPKPKASEPRASQPRVGPPPTPAAKSAGLLGLLKPTNAKTSAVKAEIDLNENVSESLVEASSPQFLKGRPASNPKNTNDFKRENIDLSAVATDLNVKDSFDSKVSGFGSASGRGGKALGSGRDIRLTLGSTDQEDGEDVSGGLDREVVRAHLSKHRNDIRACYEKALLINSKVKGRLVLKWSISAGGPVSSIETVENETHSTDLEICVQAVIKATVFPKSSQGSSTIVIYPFLFQSS